MNIPNMNKYELFHLISILFSDSGALEIGDDLTVDSWRPKLEYFLCKVYAELRY